MPLCNRKGSLLNLIIKDIEEENDSHLHGGPTVTRSHSVLPPRSPLLSTSRTLLSTGISMTTRRGSLLPASTSPFFHSKLHSVVLGPLSPVQKCHSLCKKDAHTYKPPSDRRISPFKIRHRRCSNPELCKSKFSFEKEDVVRSIECEV